MTCAWIETSSAETGSSQTISFGDRRPARGRCRCAGAGRRRIRAGSGACGRRCRPTVSSSSTTRSSSSARDLARPWITQRLADDGADGHARVERGVRVLEDDLHVAAQRAAARRASSARDVARPRTRPRPSWARSAAGCSGRWSTCRSPIRRPGPASRPCAMSKLTPSTACTRSTSRAKTPPLTAKCFLRFSTRQQGLGHRRGSHSAPHRHAGDLVAGRHFAAAAASPSRRFGMA